MKYSVLLFCAILFCFPHSAFAYPRTNAALQEIADNLTETGVAYGGITSLGQSRFLTVGEAGMSLENNEPVFVVEYPNETRIYPQKVMVWHEVINEYIDGKNYVLTYSPISGSLAAYVAKINNQPLVFDTDGRLYNSSSILVDRNTGSLWSQVLGLAVEGSLQGSGLQIMPVLWTTWGKAREAFPKGKVLETPRPTRGRTYGRDPYGSYLTPGNYYDDDRILYPVARIDTRWPMKTPIYGLEMDNLFVALNIPYVKEKQVVNFYVGLNPLVAWYDDTLGVVRVFNRVVWEDRTPALFVLKDKKIMDVHTRSVWDPSGKATEGNLQGAALKEYFGIYAFWFVWAAFNPESILVPGDTVVPDSALTVGSPLD